MEIRKVKVEEIFDVLALIDQYDRPKARWPSNEEIEIIYSSLESVNGCVLGAFEDQVLIGTCTVNVCPNFSWSGRPYAIIENVIVAKGHRGKGIGSAIMGFAKEYAQSIGCFKAALMTGSKDPKIKKFYESLGFIACKTGYQARLNA